MATSKALVFKQFVAANKITHAYIIEGVNEELQFDEILTFIKLLVCDNAACNECSICSMVNNGNMADLKIIEPEIGAKVIKKEQILDLKRDFSKKNTEDSPQFYIIKKAELMNAHAFNSLLKFLEEPDDHIIGFLLVNNIKLLPETIKSRCQVLTYTEQINSLSDYIKINALDEEGIDKINMVISLVNSAMSGRADMIFKKHQILKLYNTGDALKDCLKIMILALNDRLKEGLGTHIIAKCDKIEGDRLTNKQLANLITELGLLEEDLSYNLNKTIAMDKILILLQKRGA